MANTPTSTSTIYTRRIIVAARSKIVVIAAIAAIAALSYAAPVFAQSFNRSDGTGNELPSYYDSNGGLHAGIPPQNTRRLYAFAKGRHAISGSLALAQMGRQRHHNKPLQTWQ
jgi:hypothetical protein